ncbi:MAG: hypothetical protein KBB39_12140 [Phycicoccus sp.]|nr:hypothetical protein [Phycicoccus sp.]
MPVSPSADAAPKAAQGLSRRTLATGASWALPAVVVGAAAPAMAGSPIGNGEQRGQWVVTGSCAQAGLFSFQVTASYSNSWVYPYTAGCPGGPPTYSGLTCTQGLLTGGGSYWAVNLPSTFIPQNNCQCVTVKIPLCYGTPFQQGSWYYWSNLVAGPAETINGISYIPYTSCLQNTTAAHAGWTYLGAPAAAACGGGGLYRNPCTGDTWSSMWVYGGAYSFAQQFRFTSAQMAACATKPCPCSPQGGSTNSYPIYVDRRQCFTDSVTGATVTMTLPSDSSGAVPSCQASITTGAHFT